MSELEEASEYINNLKEFYNNVLEDSKKIIDNAKIVTKKSVIEKFRNSGINEEHQSWNYLNSELDKMIELEFNLEYNKLCDDFKEEYDINMEEAVAKYEKLKK